MNKSKNCCNIDDKRDLSQLESTLKLLSVQTRLKLLLILNGKEHCVCDLIPHTDYSQSLISHHLGDLENFGLIKKNRKGKFNYYRLTEKGVHLVKNLEILSKESL